MRCPNCGAFLESGRDVCFMCGTNVKNFVPGMQKMNNNNFYGQQQPMQNGFQSGGMNNNNPFPSVNDYDNIYNSVKNGDKDIFDFFHDHKGLVTFLGFVFTIVIIAVAGLIYYKVRTKEVKIQPTIGQLYYEVNDKFKKLEDNRYSFSGDKGAECNILVQASAGASANHVDALFDSIIEGIQPERNNKLVVVDKLKIFTTQQGKTEINGEKWHYLNVYYPEREGGNPTILKMRFLTIVHNGYAYNVEMMNNNNDATCAAGLDDFARSLKFLNVKIEEK